ncbi:hypothetical protein [Companilactobacillus sp. FL22-1]|uniref:hypothetical protein n=1 Tax=Companilactobacillus sp. FL22-1 TaxID=3373892 RepID=UPI003754376E
MKTNPEKVSFNVSPTDLGYVDLLISRGIYTTRTDFFHNAIKDELTNNQKQIGVLSEELHPKYDSSIELIIGTYSYSDEEILNLMRVGKTNLVVIGKLDLTRVTDTKNYMKQYIPFVFLESLMHQRRFSCIIQIK